MDGGRHNHPTVEQVFRDFKGRRSGIIKALTKEYDVFLKLCDPEKDNLCLIGLPDEKWEVKLPPDEVPPQLPEPAVGINFALESLHEKEWLTLVAEHSDAWLLAVTFFLGASYGFGKADRKRLFEMINDLPTISEVVTHEAAKRQLKDKPSGSGHSSIKSKSNPKVTKFSKALEKDKDEALVDEEAGESFCASCGEKYVLDEFWIFCDICERWFHGDCVNMTPTRAEQIKQYRCPSCTKKRTRP